LYYAGKGCKKDLKKAAMYYRLAVSVSWNNPLDRLLTRMSHLQEKQGYDTVGLSWIWKEKYND